MNILMTGATGFVGRRIVQKLLDNGHQVRVLSRNPSKAEGRWKGDVHFYQWDAPHGSFPMESLKNVDSVINLMGENIGDKRWSPQQKIKLRESRVDGTRKLIEAIKEEGASLKSFVSTSAVGIYPVNTNQTMDEDTPADTSFLATLCIDWEKELEATQAETRKVIFRVGVVLGKGGGAAAKLVPIFKLGAGGPVGNGSQMMSWIHVNDLASLYVEAVEKESYSGVINAVAPAPVSNKVFSKALAKSLKRPCLFPVPPFVLKIAMGEMSTIVLDGQEVKSKKLPELGFDFQYKTIDKACDQIASKD